MAPRSVRASRANACSVDFVRGQEKPLSLRLYETPQEREDARTMLGNYVEARLAAVERQREAELATLPSPEAWRQRQRQTRARLEEYFGRFTPKCPLNARIVGSYGAAKKFIPWKMTTVRPFASPVAATSMYAIFRSSPNRRTSR